MKPDAEVPGCEGPTKPTPPLTDRAKREATALRRDYAGQLAGRDVHIASDPIAPGVPAVGWNKVDTAVHRHQAHTDRAEHVRVGRRG